MEGRDREAQELQEQPSLLAPEPAAPFLRRLVYEILLGEPDRWKAVGVEEGQETKPEEEEQKAVPAPDDLLAPEDPQNAEGPRNPKDLLGPEDQKSPEDSKDKMPAREEAEEQGQAPGRGTDHPSRRKPQMRGTDIPQALKSRVEDQGLKREDQNQ